MDETRAFLRAARTARERRVAFLGVCAGLRREELRLLQGRHLRRPGWIWVSADIAKRGRERYVPVMADLVPIVAEIIEHVDDQEYVIPAQQFADPPFNQERRDYPEQAGDGKTIWRMTRRIGRRAGIPAPVNPHMMRQHSPITWRDFRGCAKHRRCSVTPMSRPPRGSSARPRSTTWPTPSKASPFWVAGLPRHRRARKPAYGDGGNRTHVRGRVKDSFYERSRPSDLIPSSPGRRGCSGPASELCPPGARGAHRGLARF